MQPANTVERTNDLAALLRQFQTSGYIYNATAGAFTPPPRRGTAMNCQAAARYFIALAQDRGIDRLEGVVYSGRRVDNKEFGFLILSNRSAFGTTLPKISDGITKGWDFDNHWRVRDLVSGIVYDPVFGTRSPDNLDGFEGTAMPDTPSNWMRSMICCLPAGQSMTTVYADKYTVTTRIGGASTVKVDRAKPVADRYRVTDDAYRARPELAFMRSSGAAPGVGAAAGRVAPGGMMPPIPQPAGSRSFGALF